MSEIDLSLSEIISKKKITLQKPIIKKAIAVKTTSAKPAESKSMMATQLFTSKNMGDARGRIIARKRSNMTDARDQLAQLAKSGDARDRINLKRNPGAAKKSAGIPALSEVAPSKPMDMRQKLDQKRGGAAIQVKKNYNNNAQQNGGLQTGAQGQTRMQGTALVRTVSGLNSSAPPVKRARLAGGVTAATSVTSAVQRQVINRKRPNRQGSGLGGAVIQEFHRSHPISTVPTVVVRSAPVMQAARPTQVARRRMPQQTVMAAAPTTIYREVPASRGYRNAPRPLMSSGGRLGPLAARPAYSSSSRPVLVSREPAYAEPTVVYRREPTVIYQDEAPVEYADYEYAEPQEQQPIYYERSPSPVYQQEYADEVYVSRSAPQQQQHHQQQHYGPAPPPPQPRNLSYSSMDYQPRQQRLQPRPQPQPRYQQRPQPQQRPVQQRPMQRPQQHQPVRRAAPVVRQAAPAPKVLGHRVIVSNLHPVATHEDIEELFGNIGPVSSCKMTRPGTATVIFLNLSDAHKSVEVYHNRKLDGQPMQVKIVGSVTNSGAVVSAGQPPSSARTVRARY